jgi:type 1 glutamine amidotransferase
MTALLALILAAPPATYPVEEAAPAGGTKIVLIAGSNFYKPGEHDYIANCSTLCDLLKQSPGVHPVLAIDWPKKPETLAGAKAIVMFFDGAEKHHAIKGNRATELQKAIDAGAGLVALHQTADYPKDFGDRARSWTGAAWEKGMGQRAHWVHKFESFPDHPIFSGVAPFSIDDGWLWKLKFADGMKGVTPLLRTVNPKSKDDPKADAAIVAWAYDRPDGGKAFTFTGGHLQKSFEEAGYRRFLVNGILWSAGVTVPKGGAPVELKGEELNKYLRTAK